MKSFSLVLLGVAFSTLSFGQKLEVSTQLNGGLSRFGGETATSSSKIYSYSTDTENSFTLSPYGKKYGFSYVASLQVQRVTKRNLLVGLQAGVETLQSRVNIRGVAITPTAYTSSLDYREALGHSNFRNNFINLQPFIGKRFKAGVLDLDLTIGSDIGICLKSKEEGTATDVQGEQHKTNLELSKQSVDVRPRVGLATNVQRFGLSFSYAHGLVNYLNGYDGGGRIEAYSRVFRLGLQYQLMR